MVDLVIGPSTVFTWVEDFIGGQPGDTTHCETFNTERATIPSEGVQSITLYSSVDGVVQASTTCTENAQVVADALRTGQAGTYTCDGLAWNIGACVRAHACMRAWWFGGHQSASWSSRIEKH